MSLAEIVRESAALRKAGLLACITGALSIPIPVWNAIQQMMAVVSAHPRVRIWTVPTMALMSLFTAIFPVFCFALYRSQATLCITNGLRILSLCGALAMGAVIAATLPVRRGSQADALNLLADFAVILLLIALFIPTRFEPEADIPPTRGFRLLTNIAVIAWGVWVVLIFASLVLSPYVYFQIRQSLATGGLETPPFEPLFATALLRFLSQAPLFIVLYVVHRGMRRTPNPLNEGASTLIPDLP